ncbi:MAG: glycogen synthase GlgA [Methylococcaceae bacterium]|nr:glycogen synthase GlgA [Methylococcaceae bacterium]MDZ4156627.1 glycogen synthase GlgA [Methylococcales bacterium]MDP2394777.1 glycogen synthase GlgA [Methylococcaceae bacterium]MDP3020198.1 glycogen synthase GlgA [Methylococcaceae bacterium]MDP3390739.1 glycogen synthase GlgA [Methylococcaceae bacterium]
MKKILFVTSEAHPLIKTGGLGDVAGSLPKALAELGQDVRLIIPNYQSLKTSSEIHFLTSLRVDNMSVNIMETQLQDSTVKVWLVDQPEYFGHPGNPYIDETGNDRANNAERFALFCRIAVEVAMNRANLDWKADVVHCNDWQTGLVPALLSFEEYRPASVFTIHNLAYQGLFPASKFYSLNLPGRLWTSDGLEFHGLLSFIKGGLVYSDRITTVSPTYAKEIQSSELGYNLDGLLTHRNASLIGIINGIDVDQWNPATDTLISQQYDVHSLERKAPNKTALQQRLGLPVDSAIPVFGVITRLVEQKGIDLLLQYLPELIAMPVQFAILGSGDHAIELKLQELAVAYPDKLSVTIGYDEALSHSIEAGADVFIMPSRFEPCGMNQMYSQRYGTLPIVRKTGGLADTVEDALPETIANDTASGIVFNEATPGSLLEAIKRALLLYQNPAAWKRIQARGMSKDFSWQQSAKQYLALYDGI